MAEPQIWRLVHPSEARIEVAVAINGPLLEPGGRKLAVETEPVAELLERIIKGLEQGHWSTAAEEAAAFLNALRESDA